MYENNVSLILCTAVWLLVSTVSGYQMCTITRVLQLLNSILYYNINNLLSLAVLKYTYSTS